MPIGTPPTANAALLLLLLGLLACASSATPSYLAVSGETLTFGGATAFLSGANLAWVHYGRDFGNRARSAAALQRFAANVAASGGNSIRVWLFVEGDHIPEWAPDGRVAGTDAAGTLIDDVEVFVKSAEAHGVLVTLCLWNGALMRNPLVVDMVKDAAITQSFIDNALVPLVAALADRPGVASWEVVNEPEGSVLIAADPEPCFDTSNLNSTGAGWAGTGVPMRDLQRFMNQVSAAIKATDPKALVTTGAWSEWSITNSFPADGMSDSDSGGSDSDDDGSDDGPSPRNYYSDACLIRAGGLSLGTFDYVQVHSYAWEGTYAAAAPWSVPAAAYGLRKPVLIGEFASSGCTVGPACSVEDHYAYAVGAGYAGAWDWSLIGGDGEDDEQLADAGMEMVRGEPAVRAVAPAAPR